MINRIKKKLSQHFISRLQYNNDIEEMRQEFDNKISSIESKLNHSIESNERSLLELNEMRFSSHYEQWRAKRVTKIISHFGPLWFRDKQVLELGCGYGEVGLNLEALGAKVTYSDAKIEHLDYIKKHRPHSITVLADINKEWPFDNKSFDLIIHMGVLYHLENIEFSIVHSLKSSKNVVLETEVVDSLASDHCLIVEEDSNGYDQSFTGRGSRPSKAMIEDMITSINESADINRVTGSECDSTFHQYSWDVQDSGRWEHGLRAMWFINQDKATIYE